jgi:cell wall assembly regulator SMI1
MSNNFWSELEEKLLSLDCIEALKINEGASASELTKLEEHLGVDLPDEVKKFLSIHNGQSDDGAGIVFGEQILSTESIRRCWDDWRSIDEEEMNEDCAEFMESSPIGYIKPMYTNRKWIPLTHDWGGNHIGIDFDPDEKGSVGQIIAFGRDEDTKRLIASSFAEFITKLTSSLSEAKWTGEYIEGQIA